MGLKAIASAFRMGLMPHRRLPSKADFRGRIWTRDSTVVCVLRIETALFVDPLDQRTDIEAAKGVHSLSARRVLSSIEDSPPNARPLRIVRGTVGRCVRGPLPEGVPG